MFQVGRNGGINPNRVTVTIEPGIYLPSFGVRSEINVAIAPDGAVQVTTPPQAALVRLAK